MAVAVAVVNDNNNQMIMMIDDDGGPTTTLSKITMIDFVLWSVRARNRLPLGTFCKVSLVTRHTASPVYLRS